MNKRVAAALVAGAVGAVTAVAALQPTAKPRIGCVRAPIDGGTDCQRVGALIDGGAAYFGAGNVFPAQQAAGDQCEPAPCRGTFHKSPDL